MLVPRFLYGTAWKEERTAALTRQALACGFRAVDTANQRKHYFEAGVGEAVAAAIAAGEVTRAELFLQTKFTYRDGQDHRLPYDPAAPLAAQVEQSFASSLEHLRTTYLDSYVLHGPERGEGITAGDREVWRTMSALKAAGKTRQLGVSNVTLTQLRTLYDEADAGSQPEFVQNRCYARTGWDKGVRDFCKEHGIVYQGFSLLTANARELRSPAMLALAAEIGRGVPEIVFRFAVEVGMLPLTGSSSAAHLRQDLTCFDFELGEARLRQVERIGL
jgi:diketogulonate reductase-like aldo/keto reductase